MNEACQRFTTFQQTSPLTVATKINDDEVSVLVEISGHLSRLAEVLIFKPAPIQVRSLSHPSRRAALEGKLLTFPSFLHLGSIVPFLFRCTGLWADTSVPLGRSMRSST